MRVLLQFVRSILMATYRGYKVVFPLIIATITLWYFNSRASRPLRLSPRYRTDFGLRHLVAESVTDESFTTVPADDEVNHTWLAHRERLLADPNNPKKLLLFAYMRGGSTLVGETFAHDPHAFYWYEPLDQFYNHYLGFQIYTIPLHITYNLNGTRRTLDGEEETLLTRYLTNMFSCNSHALPPEVFSHPFMSSYTPTQLLSNCTKKRGVWLNKCKAHLPRYCSYESNRRDFGQAVQRGCVDILRLLRTVENEALGLMGNLTQLTVHMWWDERAHGTGSRRPILELLPAIVRTRLLELVTNADEAEMFVEHARCMRKLTHISASCRETSLPDNFCSSKKLQVSKVLRLNMETVEPLLQAMPDLHILHYMRDPRAVTLSRRNVPFLMFYDPRAVGVSRVQEPLLRWNTSLGGSTAESAILCDKMLKDIHARRRLDRKYPGAFISRSYENLVNDPTAFAGDLYKFIGVPQPREWMNFTAHALFNDEGNPELAFRTARINGTATMHKWQHKITYRTLAKINSNCREVLKELNYPLLPEV